MRGVAKFWLVMGVLWVDVFAFIAIAGTLSDSGQSGLGFALGGVAMVGLAAGEIVAWRAWIARRRERQHRAVLRAFGQSS